MRLMSVTRDTSHVSIGPCGPLKHSPFGDNRRHESIAPLSSTLDSGENARVAVRRVVTLGCNDWGGFSERVRLSLRLWERGFG